MKIVVGQKILNLEELFLVAENQNVEVVVDAQIFNDLNCTAPKAAAPFDASGKIDQDTSNLTREQARGAILVKLIQLLKLKKNCNQPTAAFLVKMLNEDMFGDTTPDLLAHLFQKMAENSVQPSDKEIYILHSLPSVYYAINALSAYKLREAFGFFNAVLAFTMETNEFPVDYYNEYALSLRGRTSRGVNLFKAHLLALSEGSKKMATKPDLSEK